MPSHTLAGISTSPANRRRAVRSSAARAIPMPPTPVSSSTETSPLGCSTETRRRAPAGTAADRRRHRPLKHAGGRHRHRAEHADRRVAVVGDEGARADRAAAPRRRHQGHLRHHHVGHIAEIHQPPGLKPKRLQARLELGVGVEPAAALVAGAAHVGGAHDGDRHAVVDQTSRPRRRSRRRRCRSAAGRRRSPPRDRGSRAAPAPPLPGTPSMRASPS